jgi:TusA-related sulfurtransferase
MTDDTTGAPAAVSAAAPGAAGSGLPAHDVLLDERGLLCPLPIIALARAVVADPSAARVLLLADDPAAETDVAAWCAMRGRTLTWTGPSPDGLGRAYLVTALTP